MRQHLPAERQEWAGGEGDAETRELVRRFTAASVATDVDGLAALLRNDVASVHILTPSARTHHMPVTTPVGQSPNSGETT